MTWFYQTCDSLAFSALGPFVALIWYECVNIIKEYVGCSFKLTANELGLKPDSN